MKADPYDLAKNKVKHSKPRKIKFEGREYQKRYQEVLATYAPTIVACSFCGSPRHCSYLCQYCGWE
jgi:hypothetical protein